MKELLEKSWKTIMQKAKGKYWLIPFIILVLWTIDTIASLFNTGFIEVDALLIVLMVGKIGVLVYNLYILWDMFIRGNTKHYEIFKMYTGYAVVFIYVFYALPRLSWEMQGIITTSDSLRLWIFTFVSSFYAFCLYLALRFSKTQLAWGIVTQTELDDRKDKKKQKEARLKEHKTIADHIVEWVHIIIQAIITVIIIQHFTFQLYQIPTESMVPTFLINDRVFVTKFQYGPSIPLTKWHLPSLVELKRGNIVVFRSPEYTQNNIAKKIFHQFVFYLSLSTINIDRDENGEMRKELIVKRLVGMPGEKLKMIDDVLYTKTEADADFTALEADKSFSHVDLQKEPYNVFSRIRMLPLNKDDQRRNLLTKWDRWKRTTNLGTLTNLLVSQTDSLQKKYQSLNPQDVVDYFEKIFSISKQNYPFATPIVSYKDAIIRIENFHTFRKIEYFSDLGTLHGEINLQTGTDYSWMSRRALYWGYDRLLFWKMLREPALFNQLTTYLLSTTQLNDSQRLTDFQLNARKLNLRFKSLLAERYIQYLELYLQGVSVNAARDAIDEFASAPDYGELFIYVQMHYDNRNFDQFPAGKEEYIPEDKYFLMGDNRYNSLDFRFDHAHTENPPFKRLDETDPHSVMYQCSLQPYLLDRANILGTGQIRIWPPDRWGLLKK